MKKILVINNDIDTMALLKNWLEKRTYKVRYTSEQDEVAKLVKEFDPDLLIVDILQRGAIEKLEANEDPRTVPVLLMTGYSYGIKVGKLPEDDFIEKPFDLPLLEKMIGRMVLEKGKKHR